MKKKLIYFGLWVVLGVAFMGNVICERAFASGQTSITSESIREKEEQISKIKGEKETLKDGLSNLKEIKKELEKQKNNLREYVRQLDDSLAVIEKNIADLNDRIQAKEGEIQQTEIELEEALEKEEKIGRASCRERV